MDGQALVACTYENKQCMIDWNVCASFYRLFCIYFFFRKVLESFCMMSRQYLVIPLSLNSLKMCRWEVNMRFEWNTLETRPGVCLSVDGQNRLHTSLGIPLIYRIPRRYTLMLSYWLPPLSGSQQKANGGESRSSRNGRADSYRAERSTRGMRMAKMMPALVLGSGWWYRAEGYEQVQERPSKYISFVATIAPIIFTS